MSHASIFALQCPLAPTDGAGAEASRKRGARALVGTAASACEQSGNNLMAVLADSPLLTLQSYCQHPTFIYLAEHRVGFGFTTSAKTVKCVLGVARNAVP